MVKKGGPRTTGAKEMPHEQVQRLGPFKRPGKLRLLPLRPEQIHPVVRIAHRQPGGLRIPERIIFDHELVLILEGKGEWTIHGRNRPYAKHDLLFIPPFAPHGFEAAEGTSGDHIAVHFDFAPEVPRTATSLPGRQPYAVKLTHGLEIARQQRWFSGHRGERVLREIVAAHAGGGPLGAAQASAHLSGLLLSLLAESGKARPADHASRDEARAEAVAAYMREHLHEPVAHRALEKISGLSTSRMQAVFREVTGYPPMEYLRRLRVEGARRLLADHRLSVKEIAARTGFGDTSHFSKVFRRVDGLSPAHYRDALLAGRQEK